jgi:hypothetical protein
MGLLLLIRMESARIETPLPRPAAAPKVCPDVGAPDEAGVKRECGEGETPIPQLPPQL